MGTLYADSGGASTNSGSSDNNAPDVSGAAAATVVSNKTFTTITVANQIPCTAHGYKSGTGVEFTTTGTLPTGLTLTTMFYLCAVTADILSVHTNVADAESGTNPVAITISTGTGTHTIQNYTINLSGTPNLSAVRGFHCRVTTTGTSHVIAMCGGVHGMSTQDECALRAATSGTMPGGVTAWRGYFINALSTTTFRIYSTAALALAGGASDINITSAQVRSLFVQSAKSGDTIALASSSVANRSIFWIRAVSDVNDLVICEQVITLSATSNFAIGGRVNAAGLAAAAGALRHADKMCQNTDLSAASLQITFRNGAVSECAIWESVGARRVLAATSGSGTLILGANTFGCNFFNVECQQMGTGAIVVTNSAGPMRFFNSRWTDSGAGCFSGGNAVWLIDCEINNCVAPANTSAAYLANTILSGLTGSFTNTSVAVLVNCILDRMAANAMQQSTSGSGQWLAVNSTVYLAGGDGIRLDSILGGIAVVLNSILKDNGNAANEYNINRILHSRACPVYERDNCVSIAGGVGGVNTFNVTLDASDITSDPLLVAPDAAAGLRNFGLQAGSPALAADYSFLNAATISYSDMGAAQKQPSEAGMLYIPNMAGV